MEMKQVPLALALALSIGVLASGCARDSQSAADAGAGTAAIAAAADAHADADAHHDDDHAAVIAQAAGNDFPVPANHVPWTPDAPLVESMSAVRPALAGPEAHPAAATVRA